MVPTWILCLLVALTGKCVFSVNLQEWSHRAEEGKEYAIDCMPTDLDRKPNITDANRFEWYKRGQHSKIVKDVLHNLNDGQLVFTPVKSESTGIYYCQMYKGNDHMGTVVKGINVGGSYSSSNIDKYKTNIITGAIAGGSVLFLVCAVCFINNFRYLTDEQKQKRRERKEQRLAKQAKLHNVGIQNFGVEPDDNEANGYEMDIKETNTHF